MICPTCDSTLADVLESRKLTNGTRRRRYVCQACGHRWTVWDGDRPERKGAMLPRRQAAKRNTRPPLTDEQVRCVLIRVDLSHRDVAELIDVPADTVRAIRAGRLYRNIHPELMRRNDTRPRPAVVGPSCERCANWTGSGCNFGFPDPLLEGPGFASDCDLYSDDSQARSLACRPSVQ